MTRSRLRMRRSRPLRGSSRGTPRAVFLALTLAAVGLPGCGSGDPGGPRELPPQTTPVPVSKGLTRVAPRKWPVPKNYIPGASNRDVKGKYAD
jgi:hypothetical protein